jgi:hypothetical protein
MTMLRRRWRAIPVALAVAAAAAALAEARPAVAAPMKQADQGWRVEFDAICAKTQDAMVLSVDELNQLVERADKLLPALESLPEAERKVFTKRLQACRNLYQFVLETKQREKS